MLTLYALHAKEQTSVKYPFFKGIRASTQVATFETKLTNASWRENGYQDNYVGYEAKNLLTATSTQIHAIY